MSQTVNPYIAGIPLREERGFCGRRDPLSWVARELRNPGTNALVLFGQRRIGKTSLLMQLQRTLPDDAFLPVYFDLQNQTLEPLGKVLANLANKTARRVGLDLPNLDISDDQGYWFSRTFLPQLYQTLEENCRPVFLLDEFDALDQVVEIELPTIVAAASLFRFLRGVMIEDLRPAFVFTVGRRAEDLSMDINTIFKTSLVREIWVLDSDSTEVLVRQAEVNNTLHFTDDAVKRILSLTSGHPYLTQLLCQRIWERAYTRNPIEIPQIDIPEVEAAVPEALEMGNQALIWLWNGLGPAEKIYTAALAEIAKEGDTIPESHVIQVLTAHATRLRQREVELAPPDLVRRRVLEVVGNQEYRFAIELLRQWVRLRRPLRNVKDELDRLDPVAEHLFEAGQRLFSQRQWQDAVDLFHRALARNLSHFRARLRLGEALLELGRTKDAVAELERAYELDRDEARYTLVRALTAYARILEEEEEIERALAACERALQISPDERAVREVRASVWMRRGDAALEQGDLGAALVAYQEVGDAAKVAWVETLQQPRAPVPRFFNRMPRIQEPLPQDKIRILAPPSIMAPPRFSSFQLLLPLAGIFVMVGVYGGVRGDWTMAIPMVAMAGLSVVGSIVGTLMQRRSYERAVEAIETSYAIALNQVRAELESLRLEQQRIRTETDPDLKGLLDRAQNHDPRLWERRPEDADFLSVRLGIGDLPSTVAVSAPHPDIPDPRLGEAHAMESEYGLVSQVPITASLRIGPLGIAGTLSDRTDMARALVCNLAVHHSPGDVHLLAIFSPGRTAEWEWLKWLPHTYALSDEASHRYLANDSLSAEDVLKALLEELHRRQNQLYAVQHDGRTPAWPWLVLVVENYELVRNDPAIHLLLSPEGRQLNVTAIFVVDLAHHVPMGCSAIIEKQSNGQLRYAIAGVTGETLSCWPEYADETMSKQLALSLAPVKTYSLRSGRAMPSHVRLLDMMGVKDIDTYDVAAHWQNRSPDQYLKVPIGERRGNRPLVLDLNHTGHGPHGLVAGTTGSGKSELVQTLVVALALTHHPHDVGFVLVDFKGGGTFSDLVRLPHTLGMVTDLSGNLTARALVALEAEMDRRKRLFNDAGVNDIGPYQQLYWQGMVKDPLPRLMVIIDEFAELVSDYPDFMDGLIGIARVGRSLGVHLILATQSPAGVVKQRIWANTRFRICLRVESRQESMEMLHRPEAANLPRIPGRGYLQVDRHGVFELFQVARVDGRYYAQEDADTLGGRHEERIIIAEVSPLGQRNVMFDSRQMRKKKRAPTIRSDIDVIVPILVDAAKQMNIEKLPNSWPAPLPNHVTLPDLLLQQCYAGWDGAGWTFDHAALVPHYCQQCGQLLRPRATFCNSCGSAVAAAPTTALTSPPPPRSPTLSNRPWLGAVLGLLDDPAHQRQLPLLLELDQLDGQLIVVGVPGSGKEMWSRTLVMSLARTHTPDELHFYLLEFGGRSLQVFGQMPHVGGVFTTFDSERVQRLFRFLLDSLDERKNLCNQAGVDGLVRLRELQPDQSPPAIVVVITGFMEFRTMFQDEVLQLTRIIREGGPYGIHVVLAGDRVGDIPTAISSVVARRVGLRLADADEYSIVMGTRLIPSKEQRIPLGRGWYGRPPLEFQTASPGHEEDENAQIAELQQIVDRMNQVWRGPRPEPVEVLPYEIPLHQVLSRIPAPLVPPLQAHTAVPIGLDSVRMRPAFVDLVSDGPDFIISSTPQGGKTTLLLTWALTLAQLNSPQQVQFMLIAGRRNSLRSLQGLLHVLDYRRTPESFCQGGVLARLLAEIQRRKGLLSDDISHADELSHIVVMFDDYDEFFNAVGGEREVQDGLSTLAKRGRDVSIHTVVTGPLPNMGVGFNDPLVRQLKIGRSGFILRMLDAAEQNPLGLRIRASEVKVMPPGRGFIVRNGSDEMIQVAMPGEDSLWVAARVTELNDRWVEAGVLPATWPETTDDPGK